MKKTALATVALAIAIMIAAQFTSCEKYILPEVNFDPDTLLFGSGAATKPVMLNSNVIWKIELSNEQQEWISLSNSGDTTGGIIDVTVTENTGSQRKSVLTVETEAIKKKLTIIQDEKPIQEVGEDL